ncbi:MAG: hypothetical protein P8Y64_04275 [Gammaproteobacteria bacterium]
MADVRTLEVAAYGWQQSAWVARWYPEDLPPEWRLGYYANAFRSVLMPAEAFAAAGEDQLRQWAGDAGEGFAIYVELHAEQTGDAGHAGTLACLRALGERLAGLVVDAGALEGRTWLSGEFAGLPIVPREVGSAPDCLWQGGLVEGSAPLGLLHLDQLPPPRAIRQLLEDFAASAQGDQLVLFVEGPPEVMESLETLARLLGL